MGSIADALNNYKQTNPIAAALATAKQKAQADTVTTPLPYEKPLWKKLIEGSGGIAPPSITGEAPAPNSDEALRARGIETGKGLQEGRFAASFGLNKQAKADYLTELLKSKQIPVFVDKDSGELLYRDPETKRLSKVNESGLSVGDIQDLVGSAIPFTTSTLGAIGGAVGGGAVNPFLGVTGEVAGAASGEALGRKIQAQLGRAMGVNKNISPAEENLATIKDAAITGGAALGGRAFFGLANRVHAPEGVYSPGEAQNIIRGVEQAQPAVSRIQEMTGGAQSRFQPTPGQMSADDLALQAEASISNPTLKNELVLRNRMTSEALPQFERNTRPGDQAALPENYGEQVRSKFADLVNQATQKVEQPLQTVNAQAGNFVESLPVIDRTKVGSLVRQTIAGQRKAAKDVEDAAWDDFRDQIGYNYDTAKSAIDVPVEGGLETTINRIKAEAGAALNNRVAKKKTSVLGGMGDITKRTEELVGGKIELGLKSTSPFADPEYYVKNFEFISEAKPQKVDLYQLGKLISDLKEQQRNLTLGKFSAEKNRDLTRMIDGATQTRAEFLRKSGRMDVLSSIEDIEALTKMRASTYDSEAIGKLFKVKKGGGYKLANEDILDSVLKDNSPSLSGEFANLISKNPEAMDAVRQGILGMYRAEFGDAPSEAAHKAFIKKYGEAIKPFFREQDWFLLNQGKSFSRLVDSETARTSEALAQIRKGTDYKLSSMNPEDVANAIANNNLSLGETRRVASILKSQSPSTLDGVIGIYSQNVGRQVISPSGGVNQRTLNNIIAKNGEHIKALMGADGERYIADLRILSQGAEIAKRKGKAFEEKIGPKGIVINIARAVLGPLHRGTSASTQSAIIRDKVATKARQRALMNIINDPNLLRTFIENRNAPILSEKGRAIMAQIGAYELIED